MMAAGRAGQMKGVSATAKRGPLIPVESRESNLLENSHLEIIQRQPGVLAVLAFSEGFAVKSIGSGDFEKVAAVAEDFLRSGQKIISDMNMGGLDQITLEAGDKKCIVAPYGDLCICLITTGDVNLGLIRIMIRLLQGKNETGDRAGS
jgi:predicted regulator of Ras-like GTPase activity (Roadblock/LC7/MglB family)